jgi:hypothetical protein
MPALHLRSRLSTALATLRGVGSGRSTFARRLRTAARPLRTVGFWAAVALPALHVPLLLTGLDTTGEAAAFAALVALNGLALRLGHGHDPA